MTFNVKNAFAILAVTFCSFTATAQKKELTDEQFFKGNFKGITQALPQAGAWVDESHVIIRKDGKTFLLDCKKGTEVEYKTPAVTKPVAVKPTVTNKNNDLFVNDIQLTNDKDKEVNPIVSPDGNYVAYTKNNNLYTVNISTK